MFGYSKTDITLILTEAAAGRPASTVGWQSCRPRIAYRNRRQPGEIGVYMRKTAAYARHGYSSSVFR